MFLATLVTVGADPLITQSAGPVLGQLTAADIFSPENLSLIGFLLATIWNAFASKGNRVIAAVEAIKTGTEMTGEAAKVLAVKSFKSRVPVIGKFIPDAWAGFIIQNLFDRTKKTIEHIVDGNAKK